MRKSENRSGNRATSCVRPRSRRAVSARGEGRGRRAHAEEVPVLALRVCEGENCEGEGRVLDATLEGHGAALLERQLGHIGEPEAEGGAKEEERYGCEPYLPVGLQDPGVANNADHDGHWRRGGAVRAQRAARRFAAAAPPMKMTPTAEPTFSSAFATRADR